MSDCERRILTHRAHFCLQNYEWDYKRCQHCPFKSKYGGKFEAHMFNNHNDGFSKNETEGDDEEQDVRKTKVSENESVRKIKHEPALSQTIGAEKNVNVWLHECADCPFKTISERKTCYSLWCPSPHFRCCLKMLSKLIGRVAQVQL